jgi:phosphatidylglycerol:prolipoprotein diacylglycerol transferase
MFPYISIFGRDIAVYAIMSLCGIFAAGIFACAQAKKAGLDDTDFITVLLAAAGGAFAGGHLLYALVQHRSWPILAGAKNLKAFFSFTAWITGGQVFYGGLFGALAAGFLCGAKQFRSSLPRMLDLAVPVIPLFHFFGRLGCFAAGCCYGAESTWGPVFTRAIPSEANGSSRIPVQLVEAAFNLGLFFLLFVLGKTQNKKPSFEACGGQVDHKYARAPWPAFFPRGRLLYVYLLLYPPGRFVLEFFRGDRYRGFWGPLSTSQWISMALAAFAFFALNRPAPELPYPRRLILAGPKHSGKSAAGAALGRLMGLPFRDLDQRVKEQSGKNPRALYEEGKDVFLDAEGRALRSLLEEGTPSVLALGGGTLDNPAAAVQLKAKGLFVICLELDAKTSWKRIAAFGDLPPFLLGGGSDPQKIHRNLHRRRTKICKGLAAAIIACGSKSPEMIAGEIAALLPAGFGQEAGELHKSA